MIIQKFTLSMLFSLIYCISPIMAESMPPQVISVESLSQIPTEHPAKTLFLFDLDDTIFDSSSMIGSRAWRRYIVEATKKIDPSVNWHDIFSYALAQKHSMRAVEENTSFFVKEVQAQDYVVAGFTSRERNLWYDMKAEGVDRLTVAQLKSIDVDFDTGTMQAVYPDFAKNSEYYGGVFFANIEPKGKFLKQAIESSTSIPEKIVFVDDKPSQVESVAKELGALGIPHESYLYTATDKRVREFNPLIANIQLYYFYQSNGKTTLSNEEAALIAEDHLDLEAEFYLNATMEIAQLECFLK